VTIGDAFGPGERRPQLQGVSGWLLFLCISLVLYLGLRLALLLWAIFVTARILVAGGSFESLRPEVLAIWAVMLGLYLLGIAGGVLLYKEKLLGLRLVQAFFGTQLLLGLMALTAGLAGLLPTALASAWLAYLVRSERVRNTYFRNTSKQTAEVFR
jgi:hypothetical protein